MIDSYRGLQSQLKPRQNKEIQGKLSVKGVGGCSIAVRSILILHSHSPILVQYEYLNSSTWNMLE